MYKINLEHNVMPESKGTIKDDYCSIIQKDSGAKEASPGQRWDNLSINKNYEQRVEIKFFKPISS